jgi:hypothetical protein
VREGGIAVSDAAPAASARVHRGKPARAAKGTATSSVAVLDRERVELDEEPAVEPDAGQMADVVPAEAAEPEYAPAEATAPEPAPAAPQPGTAAERAAGRRPPPRPPRRRAESEARKGGE